MSSTDWQGRKLHFLGIGGAGMSGLAAIALVRGATVTGSDRADNDATAMLRAAGAQIQLGQTAAGLPAGPLEIVRSTAITADNPELQAAVARGDAVLHRSELLAELVRDRRTIAVAGAHGKTTTSSMIAHALHRLGLDPSWVIGGTVRSLGASAHWGGEDGWLVVEADESDRSFLRLQPAISVVTNIELDHDAYASLEELEGCFAEFLAGSGESVLPTELARIALPGTRVTTTTLPAGDPLTGVPHGGLTIRLAVPGSHNAGNAALAIEALVQAGVGRREAAGALVDFVGAGRRFEPLGQAPSGARVVDDYAHHPTEVAATIEAARAWAQGGRVLAVFQPHLFSRTRDFALAFAEALATADEAVLLPIYPARERQADFMETTSASLEAEWPWDAAAEPRLVGNFDEAVTLIAGLAGPDDVVLVMGAGDVRAVGERLVGLAETAAGQPMGTVVPGAAAVPGAASRPAELIADQPLTRMSTVRTGGAAQWFARVADRDRLVALLAWARDQQLPVHTIGSGSNLMVSDAGVPGLVLRLDGELGAVRFDGHRLTAGGGARLPSAAAAAARLGLAGLEYGVSIPGTVGGAVRMNANAYGGQLATTLEWVDVATADGVERRSPDALGFDYRHSNLTDDEVVVRAAFELQPSNPVTVKAAMAAVRDKRRATQPSGIKTFGSTFKNPPPWPDGPSAGMLLEAAGCRGLEHGAARLSPVHANFVENTGVATTTEIVELMQLARERVHAKHGIWLEPEVRTLGPVALPWA